jgi:hypothetical protein
MKAESWLGALVMVWALGVHTTDALAAPNLNLYCDQPLECRYTVKGVLEDHVRQGRRAYATSGSRLPMGEDAVQIGTSAGGKPFFNYTDREGIRLHFDRRSITQVYIPGTTETASSTSWSTAFDGILNLGLLLLLLIGKLRGRT